jgi:hypothetical protein
MKEERMKERKKKEQKKCRIKQNNYKLKIRKEREQTASSYEIKHRDE